jgi:hypothetical protein
MESDARICSAIGQKKSPGFTKFDRVTPIAMKRETIVVYFVIAAQSQEDRKESAVGDSLSN